MIALIPIKNSMRLKNKHFLFLNGKKIIDIIVEKISNCKFFDEIIIYSHDKIEIKGAKLLIDNELSGVKNVLKRTIENFNDDVFLIGGDMPFVSCESISKLLGYPKSLISIPRWNSGYFEPLHAFYPKTIEFPGRNDMKSLLEKNMFISVNAESFPENTFFNINRYEDYIKALELVKNQENYK